MGHEKCSGVVRGRSYPKKSEICIKNFDMIAIFVIRNGTMVKLITHFHLSTVMILNFVTTSLKLFYVTKFQLLLLFTISQTYFFFF